MASSVISSQIDLATALEISVNDPLIESKFNALKTLHAKKIKSLMGSIDALQKEIAKMKTLTKDNRRTQMIQVLKKTVRDLEKVIDVLKEELMKKDIIPKTSDELSEFIIKQTIDGPKRFRPKTREEMELEISELEKKFKKLSDNGISTANRASINGAATKAQTPRNQPQTTNQTQDPVNNLKSSQQMNDDDRIKIALMADEIQKLNAEILSREDVICQLKEQLQGVRLRNVQLVVNDEEHSIKSRQYNDIRDINNRLHEEILDLTKRLAESQEEAVNLTIEVERQHEDHQLERMELQQQCEQLMKQNAAILRKMTEAERALVDKLDKLPEAYSSGSIDKQKYIQLEHTCNQFKDQLKINENKITDLTAQLSEIRTLKDKLRESNQEKIELKRTITELQRHVQKSDQDTKLRNSTSKISNEIILDSQFFNNFIKFSVRILQNLIKQGIAVDIPSKLRNQLESILKMSSDENNEILSKFIGLLDSMVEDRSQLDLIEASEDGSIQTTNSNSNTKKSNR
eukprot:gene8870-18368_t